MRKLLLLLMLLAVGALGALAQTDVTASYIGDVTLIVNGGGHSHGSQNHAESAGRGWWNNQTLLSGWHAFAAPDDNGAAGESWQSGFGSAGVMMGRTMVLPEGNYTLSFEACGMNATNSAEPSATPVSGDAVGFLTGQPDVDITNSAPGDNTFHTVSFTFDVTTANTSYEFGIKKVSDESKIDWCQIKNIKLVLNSTNITPVDNSSISGFTYSGSQTWHTNTWSVEGQSDGTRFQVPFHELWVASGGTLSDATITGSYTPTANGVYKVSAWVRAMNEAGGDISGVKIFVGDAEADACTGSSARDGKARIGTFSAMADGVSGTPFYYGFKLENATLNWLSFKNVTITYYPEMPDAEKNALLGLVPTGKMSASVKNTLDGYVTAFESNASVANYNALSLYIPTAVSSVAVYTAINTAISNYATKAAALDAAGQAAYDASGIQAKYDNGTYETLAEAESELATAFATAVKAQTTVGSDWTGLIVNPSFESDINVGWTYNMVRQSNNSFGKTGNYYAEKYEPVGRVGVSQTITGMPAGVYRMSAHVKARGVTSAKLYAAGIEQAIKVEDKEDDYSVEFACDANADITIGFEGVGTDPKTDISWLCVDNFTLTLVSAGLPDVVAVEGKMNAEVAQQQTDAISAYNADKTVANYNVASVAIAAAQTSKDAYLAASTAITKAENLQTANNFVTSEAATTFAEAIAGIKTNYEKGALTDENAYNAGKNLGVVAVGWHASATNTPASNYIGSTWSSTDFVINDWSVEGESDESNFTVPFIQYWTGDANSLGKNTWTGTLTGLDANKLYSVSAWVRVRQANSKTKEDNGITFQVGDGKAVDVTGGEQVGSSQFYLGTFTAKGKTDASGNLTIKFNVAAESNISWLAFKNVKYTEQEDVLVDVTDTYITNSDFEGEYTVYSNPRDDRAIYQPEGWTIEYNNGKEWDMTILKSGDLASNTFDGKTGTLSSAGDQTYKIRFNNSYKNQSLGLYQTKTLRPGKYVLSADYYKGGSGGDAYIEVGSTSKNSSTNGSWSVVSVDFTTDGKTEVKLGCKAVHTDNYEKFYAFDNFKLTWNVTSALIALINEANDYYIPSLSTIAEMQTLGEKITAANEALSEDGETMVTAYNELTAALETVKGMTAEQGDYENLSTAITAAEAHVLGFDENEYAPYTNVDALTALAAAKAIDPTANNIQAVVVSTTESLNAATWTANKEELNAFYDGDFSKCAEDTQTPLDYTPTGWTASSNFRAMLKNAETYPGLSEATASSAPMSWSGGITYGEQLGYEMPLAAHTIYELKLKAAGWNNETRSGIQVSILKGEEGMATYNLGTPDRDIMGNASNTAGMTELSIIFATGEAGNYVFKVSSGNNFVLTDLSLLKAASQTLTFADNSAVPAYAPGTYPTVKIERTLSADRWATAVYPFAVSGVDNIAVLESYDAETGAIGFTTASSCKANFPFLMRSTSGVDEITLTNVEVAKISSNPAATANEASLKGTYSSIDITNEAINYVLSNNKIYKVGDAGATINPYRAYIQLADGASVKALSFNVDGLTTDIQGVTNNAVNDGKVYDLSGRVVKTPSKGMYIVNGKKVLVK